MSKIIPFRSGNKHPKEMYWLAFIEMCQRFAFWGIGNLLVFYLVTHLGFNDAKADHVYGIFSAAAFIIPLVGGYIGDKTSHFKAAILGCLFTIVGCLFMAVGHQKTLFYGLSFAALGAGLFTPSIYALLGRLYHERHHLREGGFSIYYASVNIGVFLATISMGSLGHTGRWSLAFSLAAFIQFCGLCAFLYLAKKPHLFSFEQIIEEKKHQQPLNRIDKERIALIVILSLLSIVFWMAYNQGWSSMSVFILKYTDRRLGSMEFSPGWILSSESLFLVVLSFPLAALYRFLALKKKNPSPIAKMVLSFFFMGACFFLMKIGAKHLVEATPFIKVSPLYVIGGYFCMALAEMLLAPIGLSLVTHLSPHRFTAFLVGFWYVCVGIAYYVGGVLAGLVEKFSSLSHFFEFFMIASLTAALLLIIFEKVLNRLRHLGR